MKLKNNVVEKKEVNKTKKYIKILCLIILIAIIMNCSSLFAMTNTTYTSQPVDDSFVADVLKGNALAEPIGGFLLFLGGLVEKFLSTISAVVSGASGGTGTAIMPWADAILFNAVPILDVNFMNPADGSIVGLLGGVISGIYDTVLGIAITFFGFAVMVMAIKLAISAVAAEKAKYKKALVDWSVGLVMLFTIHYFISFIFFLNESLVEVASGIVTQQLEKYGEGFQLNDEQQAANIQAAINGMDGTNFAGEKKARVQETYNKAPNYYQAALADHELMHDFILKGKEIEGVLAWAGISDVEKRDALWGVTQFYDFMYYLPKDYKERLQSSDINEKREAVKNVLSGNAKYLAEHPRGNAPYTEEDIPLEWMYDWNNNSLVLQIANMLVKYNANYGPEITHPDGSTTGGDSIKKYPISMMAEYFRQNSYKANKPETDIMKNNVYLPMAFMYVVFVVQSLLYFFAYLKRLFYVIILAIMAPVIVVADFFYKL